jgi:phospholipase/carboxylesterase
LLGDVSKVWVGGFSQGCALSLATLVTYPKAFGGVVGLSGMNALKIDWSQVPALGDKKNMPVFLYHGEGDDMIKHTIARMTY